MAVLKKENGVFTPPADTDFVENISGGLRAPLLKDDEALDADSAFWAAVIYGGIGTIAGGYIARRRAEAGKKPYAGFIL